MLVACSDLAFWREGGREAAGAINHGGGGGEGGEARPKVAKTAERDRTGVLAREGGREAAGAINHGGEGGGRLGLKWQKLRKGIGRERGNTSLPH